MRYERKYRLENTDLGLIEQIVKGHPASFRKSFPDRRVNNIYLDTPQLQCYKDNQMGIAKRKKFRVRWYGEEIAEVASPVLEVKIRDNSLGDKKHHSLSAFKTSALSETCDEVNEKLNRQLLLQPVLYNAYQRSYWESNNGLLRLTIDSQMSFRSVFHQYNMEAPLIKDEAIVLELKYPEALESWAVEMMQYLPFRMTKNSKYVNGVLLTLS